MTPILPPDKLREILFDDYEHAPDWFHDGQSTEEEAMADLHWTVERLQQIATDALVAELKAIYDEWYRNPDGTYEPIEPVSVEATISDRITQLTAVPDLPSEHETLREQGKEDE